MCRHFEQICLVAPILSGFVNLPFHTVMKLIKTDDILIEGEESVWEAVGTLKAKEAKLRKHTAHSKVATNALPHTLCFTPRHYIQ